MSYLLSHTTLYKVKVDGIVEPSSRTVSWNLFLRATAATAVACLSHHSSVLPSVKNGAG